MRVGGDRFVYYLSSKVYIKKHCLEFTKIKANMIIAYQIFIIYCNIIELIIM